VAMKYGGKGSDEGKTGLKDGRWGKDMHQIYTTTRNRRSTTEKVQWEAGGRQGTVEEASARSIASV